MGGRQGEKIMRRKSKREDDEQTVEVCLGGKGGACEKKREKKQTSLIWNLHSLPSALKKHKLSPLEKRRGGKKHQQPTNKTPIN